jgi:tetratricopeptide (TPR) repeat protein
MAFLGAAASPAIAMAENVTPNEAARRTCTNSACAVAEGRRIIREDGADSARIYLKKQIAEFPESGRLRVLLAAAYVALDNHAWAVRTLSSWIQDHPDDCEALTWLAWADMELGATDQALEQLPETSCAANDPLSTRAFLIRSLIFLSREDREAAREQLQKARANDKAYEADREAADTITRLLEPNRLPDIAFGGEMAGGYTTNALLGAPSDPSSEQSETNSALVQLNQWLRVTPDLGYLVRPGVELQLRLLHFLANHAEPLGYLNLTGRAGLYLDWGVPRVFVAYRPDYLLLSGGDNYDGGALWYVGGHRGEIDFEIARWLMIFAGSGLREFREMGRTRQEVDGGVAGRIELGSQFLLPWALSGRGYWAMDRAYDQAGGTAVVNLVVRLPAMWSIRGAGSVFADYYPDSKGRFGEENRTDLMFRFGITGWSPPVEEGLRIGVTYELSDRSSTAPLYVFTDHRVVMKVAWDGAVDLGLPDAARARPVADIPWGLSAGADMPEERLTDLLRLDEQVQNVCGCGQ